MKIKMFAVHDSKAEAYATPFFMRTTGEALRGFTDVANDPSSSINKYPSDYTLFELGELDQLSGEFMAYRKSLVTGLEVKKVAPPIPFKMPDGASV